jgi:CBS domain-containing protein
MSKLPQLKLLMTPFPYPIGLDATVAEALGLMQEHAVRHLPVMDDNHALVGVITERDIEAMKAGQSAGAADDLAVREMYIHDAYIADINEPLDNVLLDMAARHIGSVLVTRKGRLAGVFTSTDACRGFGEYLRKRFPRDDGNDAA